MGKMPNSAGEEENKNVRKLITPTTICDSAFEVKISSKDSETQKGHPTPRNSPLGTSVNCCHSSVSCSM